MKKPKLTVIVIKEDKGFGATVESGNYFICAVGDTYQELEKDVLEAINFTFEEEGFVYTLDELKFEMDLPSFFNFYKVINVNAFSKRFGFNQSLLAQYISGKKKPSVRQKKRIQDSIHKMGQELLETSLLL